MTRKIKMQFFYDDIKEYSYRLLDHQISFKEYLKSVFFMLKDLLSGQY